MPAQKQHQLSPLARVLKEYRAKYDITQEQLANELSIDVRTVRRYENNETILTDVFELRRIADVLGLDTERLGVIPDLNTLEQIDAAIERVWALERLARITEAQVLAERLVQAVSSLIRTEDEALLRRLAFAQHVTGFVKSQTTRATETAIPFFHYQEMERIARILNDQTLLNIALTYEGDMRTRGGNVLKGIEYLEAARDITEADASARGNGIQLLGRAYFKAARLASQAHQLACELATDREDFRTARQAGQQAFSYAQLADDSNLQVAALISLANLDFHLSSANPNLIHKHSKDALQAYQHAVSLLDKNVTPLLKGRTYAGIAEVYAMRGQLQESMRTMGLAYEHYPLKPEADPSYLYLRTSRYSLYVFGDAQSRLFLKQPKEADKALIAMQQETNDPEIEPITKLDMLYYQANVQIQQEELEASSTILTEAATLAKDLGSRLYFNKLAVSYHQLQTHWPKESSVAALEEVFQPW